MVAVLAWSATACGGGESARDRLAAARERWAAAAIADYELEYRGSAGPLVYSALAQVEDGVVVSVTVLDVDDSGFDPPGITVDDLFDRVEAELDGGADELIVEYDPDTGHPVRLSVDPDRDAEDDDYFIGVRALRAGGG